LIGARQVKTDEGLRFACAQFGGFGGLGGLTGLGGVAPGSGFGFGVPVRGGPIIPSGGLLQAGGSGIGPLITLEGVFGLGFSAEQIRRQIDAGFLDAEAITGGPPVSISIETGGASGLTVILNLANGLFEIFSVDGRRLGGGPTPEAAVRAVQEGQIRGLDVEPPEGFQPTTFAEPSAPIPGPAGEGDFLELLRGVLGALGQIRGRNGRPPGLEPVGIGGTVNVPVVRGSTADPRGTLRPTAAAFIPKPPPPPPREPPPPTAQQAAFNIARVLLDLLLRRRQENALRDAQRRALEINAQRLAAINAARGAAMPFGQSGFVGSAVGPFLGGTLGGLAGDAIEVLIERLVGGGVSTTQPRLPAFPTLPQLPGQQPTFPTVPGLDLSVLGGGGACPPLFRTGAGAMRVSPTPWFPVQSPDGKWFFFGHLGTPTFSKLKGRRKHHHHSRKR